MKKARFFSSLGAIIFLFFLCVSCNQAKQQTKTVTLNILCGLSLKTAMLDIQNLYKQEKPNVVLNFDFGRSPVFKERILQGEKADIFISADAEFMDELEAKGFLVPDTRKNFLSNKILLIALNDVTNISDFKDLVSNNIKQVSVGKPDTTTLGQYTQQVLNSLGILERVKSKLLFGSNSEEVLKYVETKKAEVGIVFATDAILSNKIKIIAIAPESSHNPIVYSFGVIKASENIPEAKDFLKFMQSEKAKVAYLKYRFTVK
ncbi:molybdate ABC transporter substrate-binding protein [Aerosakkonema funiforme]|uniref:molybdate ABC transporter substrate-binding protein n=1 Tax=Aerosakkonema funiforme TaxID=1246630 RepID=UPI0035BA7B05